MRPDEIVNQALAQAQECALAVIVTCSQTTNLRWAANTLTTNGDVTSTSVDVVAMHPAGGSATVSGQVVDAAACSDLVARARDAARSIPTPGDAQPLPAGLVRAGWDAPAAAPDPDALADLATGWGKALRAADGVQHAGYAEHDLTTTFLGTTAGVRARWEQRTDRVEFTARSDDATRSAWVGSAHLDCDTQQVEQSLRRSLEQQRSAVSVAPGRHRVILAPGATADLMIDLYYSADARSAREGRSVFSAGPRFPAGSGLSAGSGATRIGEELAPTGLTLFSDPRDAGPGMACPDLEVVAATSDAASTYDNGLPLQRTEWVSDGRLEHLVTPRHLAGLDGTEAAPWIDNLTLDAGGSGSLRDVIARTDDALLITCLWYNRVVDPQTLLLTGLTRDGVYVVRDGRIVGASGNFRFNESPVALMRRIVDASQTERTLAREMGDYFNRATMPALVVEDFNLSTASEAL